MEGLPAISKQKFAAQSLHSFHLGHGEVILQEGPLQPRNDAILKALDPQPPKQLTVLDCLERDVQLGFGIGEIATVLKGAVIVLSEALDPLFLGCWDLQALDTEDVSC